MTDQPSDEIDVGEVLAEMDDVGRTKWELAVARVTIRRQARRIADLENGRGLHDLSAVGVPGGQRPHQEPGPRSGSGDGSGGESQHDYPTVRHGLAG